MVMVVAAPAVGRLTTRGLPESSLAEHQGRGRWSFVSSSSICNAADAEVTKEELNLSSVTDISKLTKNFFETLPNAKMLASNPSYVIYAFKEGSIRVINQSAKDHFKLSNSSKSRIVDLALTADATVNAFGDNILLCLDEEGNITIFELEVLESGSTGAERTRWLELALGEDMPQRVILHPQDSRMFVTCHATSLRLWNVLRIRKEISRGTTLRPNAAQQERCCSTVSLPKGACDVAFSVDGNCLLALTTDSLDVWRLCDGPNLPGLQHIQRLTFEIEEFSPPEMLRFVGTGQVQALVLASSSGCDLRVYSFCPFNPAPVGELIQLLRLAAPGSSAVAQLEVDVTEYQTLAASFTNRNCFILLPLVKGWSTSSRIAFPFAQRFGAVAPSSHHALMTALSLRKTNKDLFIYRATRTEDKDGKWNIVVHQPPEAMVRPQEAKLKVEVRQEQKSSREELQIRVPPVPPPPPPKVNGFNKAHREEEDGIEGEEPDVVEAAASSSKKYDIVDKEFVKQIAASFVRGLEKRRGDLTERIVSEVVKSRSGKSTEPEVLSQVLAKVKEVREVQTASEKSLQAAARQAADHWAETSAASMASLLSKEFGQVSDGVAATLARELSQSRKFCEALARGVQKSQAAATKQVLESLRSESEDGDGESLQETLAPVIKTELRSHFELELGPLMGLRVTELLSAFREQMTLCLEGIASEHQKAALHLGRDLAPVVAEELKQVKHLIISGSQSSNSQAQLDEFAQAVNVEVLQPLHSRVRELTAQVKALRAEVEQLQSEGKTPSPEGEKAQASELQKLFQEGRAEHAFERALQKQGKAKYVDFLQHVCSVVRPDIWLNEDPVGLQLSVQVKMKLMYALAQQLSEKSLEEDIFHSKVEWINELWLALELGDEAVEKQGRKLCTQLIEALERAEGPGREQGLRKLKRTLQQAAKMMAPRE